MTTPWGSRSFNGSSDIINIGTPSVLDITSNITLSCWINPAAFPAAGSNFIEFFEKGYDGTNQQYFLRFSGISLFNGLTTSAPYLQAQSFNGGVQNGAELASYSGTNVWAHVLGNYDGTNWNIYKNGSNSGQNRSPNQNAPVHAAANVSIGGAYISGSPARFFQGPIADAAIWNVTLTQAEITALAQGARPYTIRPASLKGYWPLDGLQSPEPDLSGHADNGTLTGTTSAFGPPFMQFTPRWPQVNPVSAVPTFLPAWAAGKNRVIEGVAT